MAERASEGDSMSYTQKDRQEIAIDGGAGPDDPPATIEQTLAAAFKSGSGLDVNVVIEEHRICIHDEDFSCQLLSFAKSMATLEAMHLAGKAWRTAFDWGKRYGESLKQLEIRRALGL